MCKFWNQRTIIFFKPLNTKRALLLSTSPMKLAHANNANASLDIDAVRRLYGSALAMRLVTERKMASNVGGRLPGMDSHPDSNVMLDTLTGNDLQIHFGDFLSLQSDRADVGRNVAQENVMIHNAMEAKLGL